MASTSTHVLEIVFGFGWCAFWVYWLVASTSAKPGQSRWQRWASVRIAVVILVLVLLRTGTLRGHPTASPGWLQAVGLAAFVVGLATAVWARICLGRNWGMPMSQKAEPELVTSGPYRTVRHPIYSGIILAMIGTALALSLVWLVVVVVLGGYFVYSAVMEERSMARLFPDSYPPYQASTKMLVPYVF